MNQTQSNSSTSDPAPSDPNANPNPTLGHKRVIIRIISGQNVQSGREQISLVSRPFVAVCIDGDPSDRQAKATPTVSNNVHYPIWNHEMSFTIKVPEQAVIVFLVNGFLGRNMETVGAFALPFRSLARGYRIVPLKDIHEDYIPFSNLFVQVTVTDVKVNTTLDTI